MYLSGIRPTGRLHLGNYLGCIKPFIERQGPEDVFFIADLHSEPSAALERDTFVTQAACNRIGIANVCIESHSRFGIMEIAHGLSFHVTTGQLGRMTQFKDKTSRGEDPTLSLFSYPVLMAADIFYYGQPKILVGADQKQHVEFARDLYDKVGKKMGFKHKPEPVFSDTPRVMNLQDASEKMSKSSAKQDGIIYLDDTTDEIARKVRAAKTSTSVTDDTQEMNNLRAIYKGLGGTENFDGCKLFKDALTELLIKAVK